jgi:23S rRNA (uracil1939-C5)-methyltransferase
MDRLRRRMEKLLPACVKSVRMTRLSDGLHLVFEGRIESSAELSAVAAMLQEEGSGFPVQPWWHRDGMFRPLAKPALALHDLLPAGDEFVRLRIGPGDFVQGDAAGNDMIVRQVQQWAGTPHRVADLFCGAGNLSLPLAHATAAEVVGADLSTGSVKHARSNAKRMGLAASFTQANLFDAFDPAPYAGCDVMIVDPPRRGARNVCRRLGALLPGRIIMIHCDVASGGRDAQEIKGQGFRLLALRALDMFSYTGHVEVMSLWAR